MEASVALLLHVYGLPDHISHDEEQWYVTYVTGDAYLQLTPSKGRD